MIYDRTQADVDAAKRIRTDKIKNFIPLTEDDEKALERGAMTVRTLNRIEAKQLELAGLFNDVGYWNTTMRVKTDWGNKDIFYRGDYERILRNEEILCNAFFTFNDTPAVPSVAYNYQTINDIEKILVELDVMINDVKSNYVECGEVECGG